MKSRRGGSDAASDPGGATAPIVAARWDVPPRAPAGRGATRWFGRQMVRYRTIDVNPTPSLGFRAGGSSAASRRANDGRDMGATFVIALREGIEAALIVSIVLAYLKQLGATDRAVSCGGAPSLAVVAERRRRHGDLRRRRRVRRDGGADLRRSGDARSRRRLDVDDLLDAPPGSAHQVRSAREGRHRARHRGLRARGSRVLRGPPGRHRDRALPVRGREGNRRRGHGRRARRTGDRRGPRSRARGRSSVCCSTAAASG